MSFSNSGIKILGTGSYTPPLVVGNNDFAKFLDTSDEWITGRTGVRRRRLSPETSNSHMAVTAAERAIEDAGVSADSIGLIIATTCTPDYLYPSLSCMIQKKVNAVNAACFDLNAACTGFITALDTARAYFLTGEYEHILIVSSEKLSSHVDFTDRSVCVLFGDGAGAVLLTKSDRLFAAHIGAYGEETDNSTLYYKINYGNPCPFYEGGIYDDGMVKDSFKMDGKSVYKFATDAMPVAVRRVCEKAGRSVRDIEILVPHQANIRIIKTAAQALKIDPERVYTNIENRGNVSSACIPICLDELKKDGRLYDGMDLCFVGFGAGLTYGAVYMEY